ncbi:type II toxin-antitoxin system RelE/ParE family toxin [Staphylococcus epidermidis]|uniref:type II toxin-antitoxin system RelE/ParE family toxin n=2 Tax=Staphylococcus epidermidis TaxID=1282 RepID=UPI00066B8B9A|nr:type II toxin-antitoxin system RelE/ParE family toxin [Staphylococcus epidermidis]MBF2205087.1 type II toxin-antitoxin system RelE/ParE family toxin [Staphylococcus epidermidis]MBF2209508.1 type II toxin-antitoxin system RelE/ParE family toxin [Staphylococcus epidermidis]MBF2211736.1 type II toxin-antitoxin system RelE/ParE family toxin [Staphylococcus epidermidis]MBM0783743.1 type II toxin-antitoxin system RelE/ParE family toxin [Staphylococcus epidermidis]MBM0813748.1 type II toxin-antito
MYMSNVTFKTLKDKNNQSEFIQFVQDLPDKDRIKLLTTIQKIEEEGIQIAIRMKWVKKLDNNLYEIRSKFGSNIQRAIYFQKVNNEYIITHGFTKKTQETPKREIAHGMNSIERYRKGELYEYDF